VRLREDTPQVPLRHAEAGRELGHAHRGARPHRVVDHPRGVLREHVRRVHQAQAGRELGAAAQAGPEAACSAVAGVGEEAAVLAPGGAHAADRGGSRRAST
jgi:hypothetical protein